MAKDPTAADMANLHLTDEDTEDLFASPTTNTTTPHHPTPKQRQARARSQSETREARLRAELDRVRHVNATIESVTASLTRAKSNMDTVHTTVNNASTLLATWTRILSQTEHNQQLILSPGWEGASRDLEEIEGEEVRRVLEGERRRVEEERRREEGVRRAEEEERRKALSTPTGSRRGARGGRGVGSTRGVGGSVARGRGGSSTSRAGSGIGRGSSTTTRGRGRGVG